MELRRIFPSRDDLDRIGREETGSVESRDALRTSIE